jgi:hydrogenase maturation protease
MKRTAEFLVIGYGNTLRRDDGVGVRTAEAVAALNLPDVQVLTRHQLVPELAEPVSRARAVIFVDAAGYGAQALALNEVAAQTGHHILAHAADPPALLGLAGNVFGHCPRAWSLAIPVSDFGFGDGLSAAAEAGLQAAVREIRELVDRDVSSCPGQEM